MTGSEWLWEGCLSEVSRKGCVDPAISSGRGPQWPQWTPRIRQPAPAELSNAKAGLVRNQRGLVPPPFQAFQASQAPLQHATMQ